DQIRMTPPEAAAFLEQQRVVICATNGPRGWPHLMPLWYVVRDGEIWAWTYAKSQNVRNLKRAGCAALQVVSGQLAQELRGVMLEARAHLDRHPDLVSAPGAELLPRCGGGPDVAGNGP